MLVCMLCLRWYSGLDAGDKDSVLLGLCAIISGGTMILSAMAVMSIDDSNRNDQTHEITNACYNLEDLMDVNINIRDCKKYLVSNPDATGQDVLDHLGVKTAETVLITPMLRDG